MNLESLLDEILVLQSAFQGDRRSSENYRMELKKILCKAFEEQCDSLWNVLEKHSAEWRDTRGNTYNPFGPPGEVPLVDRVVELIINRAKKDLSEMESNFRQERGDYE